MTRDNQIDWPYPGSRWWKFDFHTHTPASADWREVISAEHKVTPEGWLRKFMDAGIDCVAVTDHNSGYWIDRLNDAYAAMRQQAENGSPPEGFRELTLFPGVEISVSGGFHLLAILEPDATSSDVYRLIGKVDFQGAKGASEGVTRASPQEAVQAVLDYGGIPIPAHADQEKGLLRVKFGKPEAVKADQARAAALAFLAREKGGGSPVPLPASGPTLTKFAVEYVERRSPSWKPSTVKATMS